MIAVRIIGDHPWTGYTGMLLAVEKPNIGILPKMGRVRLDDGQDCPYQHECYAESKNLMAIAKAQSRHQQDR